MRGWRVSKTLLLLFGGTPTEEPTGGGYPPDEVQPRQAGLTWHSRGQVCLRGHVIEVMKPPAVRLLAVEVWRSRGVLDPVFLGPLARTRVGLRNVSTGVAKIVGAGRKFDGLGDEPRTAFRMAKTTGKTRMLAGRSTQSVGKLPGTNDPALLKAWEQETNNRIAATMLLMRSNG